MSIKSVQAKSIRNKFLLVGFCILAAYTLAFTLAAMQFWDDAYQKIGYKVADITAPWNYVTQDEYINMYEDATYNMQLDVEDFDAKNPAYAAENDSSSNQAYDSADDEYLDDVYSMDAADLTPALTVSSSSYEDTAFWSGKGLYAWRDLTFYHAFANAKPAALIVCYLLGLIFFLLLLPPRLIGQIDKLALAIKGLFADKDAPINLPSSLKDARSELLDIQNRELHNEQTAKVAEQRKNELVAYLAHDIRTPLTSVIGYLDILRSTPEMPTAEREKFACVAYEKAEQLDSLIEEFFEITRYNLQSIPVEREQIDLKFFCLQIAESIYPQAQAKGLEVKVQVPEQEQVFIDPEKMARACGNILRNAIAYANPKTAVTFTAYCNDGKAFMEICDQGKEISPEHLDSIFEKFFREDSARNANKGGAGLGLAIAKEIVEAHGGRINASSSQGRTTFTIELPQTL